jgi:RNA polymerase nonessential primary-like sigma factor
VPNAIKSYQGQDNGQTSLMARYLNDISKHSLLSKEEELETSKLIQKGDEKAIDKLIECNLRLVVKFAKQFARRDIGTLNLLDLVEEGNIGLIKAAKKFDPQLGYRFSTYAAFWIKDSIQMAIMNQRDNVRVPIHVQRDNVSSRKQEPRELQEAVTTAEKFQYTAESAPKPFVELDELTSENINLEPQHQLIDTEFNSSFYSLVQSLPEKESYILINRYGLTGNPVKTLQEVGNELGISNERVRQLQIIAIDRIKNKLSNLGLLDN